MHMMIGSCNERSQFLLFEMIKARDNLQKIIMLIKVLVSS